MNTNGDMERVELGDWASHMYIAMNKIDNL